jgi:hypothetical protein
MWRRLGQKSDSSIAANKEEVVGHHDPAGCLLHRRGRHVTDCFVVDENGEFALGKAPTTPAAIADGFMNSLATAREQTGLDHGDFLTGLEVIGYGATTVLNAVLAREARAAGPG